jgi:4-amino-4-deoxy-L-arabinose transferase-like glycosyltransferase
MFRPAPDFATPFPMDKIRNWCARHPYWALAAVTFVLLAPFCDKPFNIDDPLFLWGAKQILAHPLDPFGFTVNWGVTTVPMWVASDNPPLACYYVALAGGILGWSEIAMHLAVILPTIVALIGTHRLAGHFCRTPMLAALATLFMPVFMVSSTTIMCDILMLAMWVWAVVFWVEGLERDVVWKLLAAAVLLSLAPVTKYFGLCLIPLLGVYGFMAKRRGAWVAYLLIPLAAFAVYQWLTAIFYGAQLRQATTYSLAFKSHLRIASVVPGLSFLGGCVAIALFLAPLLWRKKTAAPFAAAAAVLILVVLFQKSLSQSVEGSPVWTMQVQVFLWAMTGVTVLTLVFTDLYRHRDARSCLLALWVLGTFAFASFINWSINGRSMLPMAPAVAILIARRLDENIVAGRDLTRWLPVGLAAGAAFSLLVTRADYLFAIACRQSAREVVAQYGDQTNNILFQGHWGYQWYMKQGGMKEFDAYRTQLMPGNLLINADYNTTVLPPDPKSVAKTEIVYATGPRYFTVMNPPVGAGFYSSVFGPLPFAFGKVAPERVIVYYIKTNAPAE